MHADSNGRRRVTVVIFIDALGARIAETHGFLRAEPGRARALETVIGYSSSAIPSLMTGELPRDHGHFSMYQRDRGDGVFRPYRRLLELVHRTRGRGKTRRFLKKRLSRQLTGYFELYDVPLDLLARLDLPQRRDLFAPGAIDGHETFIDAVAKSGLPYRIWTWRDDETHAFDELTRDVAQGDSAFLLIYSARLDALMHRVGVTGPGVGEMLRSYEVRVREILRAGRDVDLHLHLFSDHGMTDVVGVHEVHTPLAHTGLRVPRDYLVFTDSTMARFWFHGRDARERLRAALPDTSWGRWLTGEEMHTYGIDFDDHRFGEAIYLLEAGHVIAPSFMGERACAAMHGYGPEDESASAWLFSAPPVPVEARSIRDLAALVRAELAWLGGGEAAR